jgi:hypothetical protein
LAGALDGAENSLVQVDTSTVFPAAEALTALCLAEEEKSISS